MIDYREFMIIIACHKKLMKLINNIYDKQI